MKKRIVLSDIQKNQAIDLVIDFVNYSTLNIHQCDFVFEILSKARPKRLCKDCIYFNKMKDNVFKGICGLSTSKTWKAQRGCNSVACSCFECK